MNIFKASLLLTVALLAGCSVTTSDRRYNVITDLEIDAPAAPDVHGANGYVESGKHIIRASGKIHFAQEQKGHIDGLNNEYGNCDRTSVTCQEYLKVYDRKIDARFNITRPFVDLSAQWLHKVEELMLGAGVSYNNGPYTFFSLGFNTAHVEAGANLGLWIYNRHYFYRGYSIYSHYDYYDGEKRVESKPFNIEFDEFNPILTYGGYMSLYYGPFFFTYSLNAYKPDFYDDDNLGYDSDEVSFRLPYVLTSYFTLGYHIDKHWEVSAGVSNIYGGFAGWHWAGQTGISYYL